MCRVKKHIKNLIVNEAVIHKIPGFARNSRQNKKKLPGLTTFLTTLAVLQCTIIIE